MIKFDLTLIFRPRSNLIQIRVYYYTCAMSIWMRAKHNIFQCKMLTSGVTLKWVRDLILGGVKYTQGIICNIPWHIHNFLNIMASTQLPYCAWPKTEVRVPWLPQVSDMAPLRPPEEDDDGHKKWDPNNQIDFRCHFILTGGWPLCVWHVVSCVCM